MIVISIILSLSAIGFFPYSYYMQRVRVENTIDIVSQEWIMAHADVRNGKLIGDSSAHVYMKFEKGSDHISVLTGTGWKWALTPSRDITFDDGIKIIGFSWVTLWWDVTLTYHITPPFATGAFSTGSTESFLTGIILKIGYPGTTEDSRRIRDILLRPYYD